MKAGTTSLYNYLSEHPQVYLSPIKEPHYFCKDVNMTDFSSGYRRTILRDYSRYLSERPRKRVHSAHIRELSEYRKLYTGVHSERAIGEFSNSYLYSTIAAKEIRKFNPNSKIIMILRNPIDRAYSHYWMDIRIGIETESFERIVALESKLQSAKWGRDRCYLHLGLYHDQVQRYFDEFDKNMILVLLYDDFKNDVEQLLKEIYRFLQVEQDHFPENLSAVNKATVPRLRAINHLLFKANIKNIAAQVVPQKWRRPLYSIFYSANTVAMQDRTRKMLVDYFEKDISKLARLIGKDLSPWLSDS